MAALTAEGLALRVAFAVLTGNWRLMTVDERARALWHGLRFDIATASIFTVLTLAAVGVWRAVFRGRMPGRGWLLWPVLMLYAMQVGDLLYAQESGRHVSYEVAEVLASGASLFAMLPSYWPYLLAAVPVCALAYVVRMPIRVRRRRDLSWATGRDVVMLPCLLLLTVLGARGGLQVLPLRPADAYTLGSAAVSATALNGAFAVGYGATHTDHRIAQPRLARLDAGREARLLDDLFGATAPPAYPAPILRRLNVVAIFLESWPAQVMRSYGYDQDVTPHFDAIRALSLTTRAMIAGGHRTTEGLFSALCSFQNASDQSVAVSQLLAFSYRCLPRRLRDAGWTTVFFQGMHRNAAGVGDLVQKLGFEFNYGKDDMSGPHRYTPNSWGVHDADLYDYVDQRRRQLREPYFIGINTTTTHDETLPDNVPAAFGMGDEHARLLSVMHFADQELGEFIDRLEHSPGRYPTVIVLVADHTAHVNGSMFYQYAIPFALYAPGIVAPQTIEFAVSQRDIAPTLLDLIGLPATGLEGESLMHPRPQHVAEYQHAGRIGWFEGSRLVDFDAASGGDLRCLDWLQDPAMQNPRRCETDDEASRDRALAFTRYSMDLLFAGETEHFGARPWRVH
jgi:hypothetical protein